MKIGVDLDGVIFDSEKLYRVCSELYEILDLKKNTIRDRANLRFQERYSWTEAETQAFIDKYYDYIVKNTNFMPGAIDILKMLKKDGHSFIIITARGKVSNDSIETTKQLFKESDLEIFDKYYWCITDKAKICKEENIDLMIDDYNENCLKIANEGIKTIYLKDAPSYEISGNEHIITLYNWGEIYRFIKEEQKCKK